MKKRLIAGVLIIALGLTGCGSDETVEAIATPANTTAATFEMSTTEEITTVSETTPSVIYNDDEETLKNLIIDKTHDELPFWEYGDLDNNGTFEAFAFTGKFSDANGGSLWLVNSKGMQPIGNLVCDEIRSFTCDKNRFIYTYYNGAINRQEIWGVDGENFYIAQISNVGIDLTIDENEDITLMAVATDNITFYDDNINGANTWKPYYFYYDNGFQEYGGSEMSPEELFNYTNAVTYVNEIENLNGEITNIIVRENGIININYRVPDPDVENLKWNYYYTLKIKDDIVLHITDNPEKPERDNGFYLPALMPEIATVRTIAPKFDFPRVDGSTSTEKLDVALSGYFHDNSVHGYAYHSTTFGSFQNLLSHKCDIIFSVPISESQLQEAENTEGFELVSVPIALEGFVFLINPQNPVKSLTQEQIRDIYSGKITNWLDVGGEDAEIIAYQRNIESGSQTFMTEFMGETPLAEAPFDRMPDTMGLMTTALSSYDNSKYAIGYSVFSYAAQVQAESGNLEFVAVDGIAPSGESFTDGSYPLMSYTYAYYNKNNPNPNVQKFINDILSDEGQKIVADAGYYPINPPVITEKAYYTLGTGREKPVSYKTSQKVAYLSTKTLDILNNKAVREKIEKWVSENAPSGLSYEIINGYISYGSHAIWDLYTGEKLEFSDLFYNDVDFLPVLNEYINKETYYIWDSGVNWIKYDFVGLISPPETFTLRQFFLGEDYYFPEEGRPRIDGYYYGGSLLDLMPVFEYRDMSDILTVEQEDKLLPYYTDNSFYKDGNFYYQVESRYEDVTELNNELVRAFDYLYEHKIKDAAYEYDISDNFGVYWDIHIREEAFVFYGWEEAFYVDRKTGKLLSYADMFDISKADFDSGYYEESAELDYTKIFVVPNYDYDEENEIYYLHYFLLPLSAVNEEYKDLFINYFISTYEENLYGW